MYHGRDTCASLFLRERHLSLPALTGPYRPAFCPSRACSLPVQLPYHASPLMPTLSPTSHAGVSVGTRWFSRVLMNAPAQGLLPWYYNQILPLGENSVLDLVKKAYGGSGR